MSPGAEPQDSERQETSSVEVVGCSDRLRQWELQAFHERILRVAPRNPATDFPHFCDAWRAISGADWVWFWLFNKVLGAEEWELIAHAPRACSEYVPAKLTAPGGTNVGEYSWLRQTIVRVKDLRNWQEEFEGRRFTVGCLEELQRMGCKAFDCIPLLGPIAVESQRGDLDDHLATKGFICLHYKTPDPPPLPDSAWLILMGRLTAHSIVNSYEAEQREILVDLNALAEKFLAKLSSRYPHETRSQYLKELILLVKKHLHVGAVSIFYRDFTEQHVQCLASTGICDRAYKKIPIDNLSEVTYGAGDSLTGKCFSQGVPIVLTTARPQRHEPKYLEMPGDSPIRDSPVIFYPIPSPGSQDRGQSGLPALGVIRCAAHTSPHFSGRSRSFDPVEIQTLGFIARQIGPILQTMAANIQREHTISVIKHDLQAPLSMIMDRTAEIASALQGKDDLLGPYTLKDLSVAALVESNLVLQLDPDPSEVREFNPEPTHLESDIVARIKSMLSHYAWGANRMTIRFENFQDIIPRLYVDRTLIERALNNLIINAIKYGRRGTTISIVPRRSEAGFYVDVINFGLGIEPEEEPYIFKPHYRSPRAKVKKMGSGLGLTITKSIMESHGGRLVLTARKEPTVFSLFFPRQLTKLSPP